MSALPAPLSPAGCDLRGLDWMPLYGHRLYTSEFYDLALGNPRGGIAAQKLWWVAWQQCPAGSLPADDRMLARLADFGTDMRGWGRAKAVALHGFVLCSDDRLYHPMLCEQAIEAWDRRKHAAEKKRRQRERSREAADRPPSGDHPAAERPPSGCHSAEDQGAHAGAKPHENNETAPNVPGDRAGDVPADRTGQDRTGQNKDSGGDSARTREGGQSRDLPFAPCVPAEAVLIIEAFDVARTGAFGQAAEPRFPAQMDRIDAGRWLKAGAEVGMTPAEVVQMCGDVFQAVHKKLAAKRNRAPFSLAFHDADIAAAIARRSQPLPEATHAPAQQSAGRPAQGQSGERRTYGVTDPSVRRRAMLNALADELEPRSHAAG